MGGTLLFSVEHTVRMEICDGLAAGCVAAAEISRAAPKWPAGEWSTA